MTDSQRSRSTGLFERKWNNGWRWQQALSVQARAQSHRALPDSYHYSLALFLIFPIFRCASPSMLLLYFLCFAQLCHILHSKNPKESFRGVERVRELKERKRRMNEKSISVPAGLRARTALFSFRQTHFHSHELFKSFSFDTLPNYNIHTCASTLPQQ